ncbi:Benzil reductase ((S)-benzoin forming) [Paenibacillus plantiphilus]|uniref:Benzil reductase ((S)-benzoin forming) n=1 Tax=Paenibacillus plantiphilus TaxID=2905650 RepID=A0ABN8G6R6_9BACL|nr:(S)-benzoin forming benzil reductase [Paenibacillus plantiphilus]CAH1198838.1 Benzil reductase ((S)-benzoin forming) [Paenibacillus plantiphilus]
MKYFIITGTSRGIGEALANQLLAEDHHIFCISRTPNERVIERAREMNARLSYYAFDLNQLVDIDRLFEEIFHKMKDEAEQLTAIYLINNAGMLAPVAPIEHNTAASMMENVNVNLIAPMITTSNFIKRSLPFNMDKRIMNISSASARYLLPSQSCYSTSKAGLDSFTKSVSIEQSSQQQPVKVVSVYPGMIDTQLQAEIRSASKEQFPYVDQFIQLEQEGKLQTPEYTAAKLIDILFNEEYGVNAVVESL